MEVHGEDKNGQNRGSKYLENGRDWTTYPHPCTALGGTAPELWGKVVERSLRCLSRRVGKAVSPMLREVLG